MTIHCTHDFLTNTSAVAPSANMYYLALFLTGVLGFTRVGQTNFNVNPLQSGTVANNRGASINLGSTKEYYVQVPTASYTVTTSGDNGKILVLKSRNFPLANSGLFRVLSGSVADNAFIVDYRTPGGTFPPIETGSLSGSLDWQLWNGEGSFATSEVYASNGLASGHYRTWGSSTYPRLIMQSPFGWHVRLCLESADDRWNIGDWRTGNTVTVGMSGNIAGDWSVGGETTHAGAFWDDGVNASRKGNQCGIDPLLAGFAAWTSGQWRVFMWGDDQTGSVYFVNRNVTVGSNAMCIFGMPENEPQPPPARLIHRLFTIGDSQQGNPGGPTWNIGTQNEYSYSGQAYGFVNQPVSCVMSSYHIIYTDAAPRAQVTSDNPVLKATEVIPVELLAATWLTQYIRGNVPGQNMSLEPRKMGLVPMVRQGRNNFASWTTSTDPGRTWFHVNDGMYLPWGGLAVLP